MHRDWLDTAYSEHGTRIWGATLLQWLLLSAAPGMIGVTIVRTFREASSRGIPKLYLVSIILSMLIITSFIKLASEGYSFGKHFGGLVFGSALAWYPSKRRRWVIELTALALMPAILRIMSIVYLFKFQKASDIYHVAAFCFLGGQMSFWLAFYFGSPVAVVDGARTSQPRLSDLLTSVLPEQPQSETIFHVSDLHISNSEYLVDRTPACNERSFQAFSVLKSAGPSSVILTGDITDRGSADEWRIFLDNYPKEIFQKTILVPGNHDVNILSKSRSRLSTFFRLNDRSGVNRSLRLARMLAILDEFQGERAVVVDEKDGLCSLRAFIDRSANRIDSFVSNPVLDRPNLSRIGKLAVQHLELDELSAGPLLIHCVWNHIFPMAIRLGENGPYVIVLDSNRPSVSILDQAFGQICRPDNDGVLKRLKILIDTFKDQGLLFAMHHHLILPMRQNGLRDRIKTHGMVLLDAPDFYQFIIDHYTRAPESRQCIETLILHGHRHIQYQFGLPDGVSVISSGSTSLGDEHARTGPSLNAYKICVQDKSIKVLESKAFQLG